MSSLVSGLMRKGGANMEKDNKNDSKTSKISKFDNIEIDNTPFFSSIPNDFLENPLFDAETIAVGCYLAKNSQNWKVHPTEVMKRFKFSDKIWRRVSANLKLGGYLVLKQGGNRRGGSSYKFSIWRKFSGVLRDVPFGSLLAEESPQKYALNKDQDQITKINNVINNKQEPLVVVDNEIVEKLTKYGINKNTGIHWFKLYGKDKILEKVKMLQEALQRGNIIPSKGGWLKDALAKDYAPIQGKNVMSIKQVEETQRLIQEKERIKPGRRPEDTEAINKLKGKKNEKTK